MTNTLTRLKKVNERVEYILNVYPQARSDDRVLISCYYEMFHGVSEDDSFFDVMGRALTNFETIRRARARIQEENIELRADMDIEAMRIAEQKGYLDYLGGEC